jgi:Glycosyl hydrolases family 18
MTAPAERGAKGQVAGHVAGYVAGHVESSHEPSRGRGLERRRLGAAMAGGAALATLGLGMGPSGCGGGSSAAPGAAPALPTGSGGGGTRTAWQARDLALYNRVKFFDMVVDGEGRVAERRGWPATWDALTAACRSRGVAVDITLTLFDAAQFERVFTDTTRRNELLAQSTALAQGVNGLHIDFEVFDRLSAASVSGFRAYLAELRARLTGKSLSAFCVMGAQTDLYSRSELELLDHVVLQGYDAHYARGQRAGPVAPLRGPYQITWESTLRTYTALGAARSRIHIGVPYYGYEWPTASSDVGAATRGAGREMTYAAVPASILPNIQLNAQAEVARHGQRRDPASGSPYYAYQDATGWRQGWFEDETSLAAKFDFVKQEGLGGVAIFPIGYDAGAFDPLLRRAFRS